MSGAARQYVAGVDWFTATGLVADLDRVLALLRRWWGDPVEARSGQFYARGYRWACGALLQFSVDEGPASQNVGLFTLTLSGSVLAQWGGRERLERLAELDDAGASKCTRLDCALDVLVDEGDRADDRIELAELAERACYRGDVRGFRTWKSIISKGKRGYGLSVTLGQRGRWGCGRQVVIYDKGVESGRAKRNKWQRLEGRYYGAAAQYAWRELVCPWRVKGRDLSGALALGCVDFRDRHGRGERLGWWRELVGAAGGAVVVRPAPRERCNLERWARWIAVCVMPSFSTMGRESGLSQRELWERIGGWGISAGLTVAQGAHVWEFLSSLGDCGFVT